MPKEDMSAFVETLGKKPEKKDPSIKVEFPEPVLKWRHTIVRDGEGRMKEVISEAIE